ncbi:MAG TPA: SGNH/GDSL hydrolase family protein, partial [Solirubrobacteraceae bacterium]|nr:SGNH/GDSL hydrolase family protein [Solirubrobacteraceae bacterium]
KKLAFAAITTVAIYVVVEGVVTAVAWSLRWGTTLWLYEDSGRTVRFDPIRGYRLTRTPSRFLRATDGRLEYIATIRGNSQGFPDRDDFGPRRTSAGVPRLAVFGDSFTEGQYLGQSWPDRAEDLAREAGQPVELLNFALGGAGLANWWSVLTKLVVAENYEIDGVLFVVFAGDLRREFTVSDHQGRVRPLFGRTPSWDPATYPTSLDAARSFLKEQDFAILSPAEFERAVQGHWPRGVSRPVQPYILTHIWRRVVLNWPGRAPGAPPPPDESGRDRLIADIRRVLEERHLPALVVHIPDRAELIDVGRSPEAMRRESRAFAEAIGARFLDGGLIFEGLSRAEIRGLFFPHDGHWNQAGSDRFAAFLLRTADGLVPDSHGKLSWLMIPGRWHKGS